MCGRLRARAARLMRQLDAGAGYREQIERELRKRLETAALKDRAGDARRRPAPRAAADARRRAAAGGAARACAACATVNDADARFCKECGAKL